MKQMMMVLALLAIACGSRPPARPAADAPRMATEIRYVGVPNMNIYALPSDGAPVITTYGYTETVSIFLRDGDWAEVRTVDGSGWVHTADLIGADVVEPILKTPSPRFLTTPVAIPDARAHGEIVIQAKVNTDGDVIGLSTVKNTTGSKKLAEANSAALQQAKFYPIVQKGQRLGFTYTYDVSY